MIHFILCAVHICCHGNRELRLNKSEIKRELMERREWHQIMLQNSNWSSSSDENKGLSTLVMRFELVMH